RAAHLPHRRRDTEGPPARSNRARGQLFPEDPGARVHRSQLAVDRASRPLPLRLAGRGRDVRGQRRARALMEGAPRRDLRRDRQAQQQDARRRSRRRARDGNNAVTGILDLQVFDPAKQGLLARLTSPDSSGLLSHLPPSPAREVARLAWRGLQALAPNLTNPATYAPLPPPAWTPTPEGKLPSSDRDPRLEGALSDLVNIAMLVGPQWEAGLARGPHACFRRWREEARRRRSRSPPSPRLIYNPPPKPPRPFEADYPHGAPADATGRLTQDIEGRPLTAKYIVGRSAAGAEDQAF